MKAVVVRKIGEFELADIPTRAPRRGEVLVRVAVAGLCRTDLKIIEVGHRDLVLPRVPGEEAVGTVIRVGPSVSSDWLGRRVYVYPGVSCGECRACRQGAQNLCRRMSIMGFHRDGGFASFVTVPAAALIPLPRRLSFDLAVFAEPLSCCLNALELGRLSPGDRVGVWGAGPAGTLLARASSGIAASVTVIEPDVRRRRLARGVAAAGRRRFDLAVVAIGSPAGYDEALASLTPRGRLVVFSGLARADAVRPIDFNQIHYAEQTVTGAYGCSYRHGVDAIRAIAAGRIRVDDMISHRLPLAALADALDMVRSRKGMKILLYPEHQERRHE